MSVVVAPTERIKYSDIKPLIPGTISKVFLSNLRNFNLNTPPTNRIKLSNLQLQYAFPTVNAPLSSLSVCYSVRLVVFTYTGPVFKLRRSSDNVLQDFYTDKTQSYLTT